MQSASAGRRGRASRRSRISRVAGSSETRSVRFEQLAQDRAMTALLVLAITAHGARSRLREHTQELQQVLCFRRGHFFAVALRERLPLRIGLCGARELYERFTRCEL